MTTYIPSLTLPRFVFEQPAASILLPIVAGAAIGYSTSPSKTQKAYLSFRQPPFNPPPYIFGPAWTTLYALMGYASHRAFTTGASSANPSTVALAHHGATLYTIQLALNFLWTPLFFGLNRPKAATADILALGGTVAYMTYVWAQVDEVAAWCMAPYLGWLGFATYLCVGIGYLNDWDLERGSKGRKE